MRRPVRQSDAPIHVAHGIGEGAAARYNQQASGAGRQRNRGKHTVKLLDLGEKTPA
jgi:hypothetical protein